ncbi:ARM repeat-containing protein [Eremomyces bilateralis CBS 781.70]|uniref:ARM repeat-containing protein n=1 Tax=Eremomyces bilateralis CBS 781.70 TaxID=1392243 RepID=A0A6G1G5S4_9PEZI|nr:ARM repeat-containing protein [Eremomyces bilateralis CBS 781.70]KAF1813413.1 ARM repeat-containing protein [Eremomyces bilateralis CBS 781.70]
MGDMFSENLGGVFDLLRKTIQDPESIEVRVNTMLALSRISMLIDAEEDEKSVKDFQSCVPGMMIALKDAVLAQADHAAQAFEVFHTFIAADGALLDAHFKDIVKFMMDLASQPDMDEDSRSQALGFLMQAARYKRLKIQSLRIGEELTLRSLQIVKELNDLASDDEDLSPARMALSLIDYLASSLPPSQVVVPLLRAIGPYVTSQDPGERRAGLIALGQCVEGAPDFMSSQLKEIMPMVLSLLEDSNAQVREAALSCIARLADDLAEELGKYHEQLIPTMIRGFDAAYQGIGSGNDEEAALRIIRSTCDAIDSLIEGLEKEDAAKYAPELVQRFSRLLEHDDYRTRSAAIGAVGSIASAAEEGFIPYFKQTMQALGKYVEQKESQEELDLRCVVVDSMGKIAIAVGPEEFKPFVVPLMQSSEEALHLDHPHVRETSYILWSTMAKLYEEDFAPYLDGVAKGLLDSLNQEEGNDDVEFDEDAEDFASTQVTIGGKKFTVATAKDEDGEEEIIDLDPSGEDWEDEDFEAITAIGMEKEIAIECIGDVLSYTKARYLPHFEKTIESVLKLAEHSYEGIRKAAIVTLWRAYAVVAGLAEQNGAEKWKPGFPLKVQPSDDIMKLGDMIMTATLPNWEEEDDRPTVTDLNRILAATLKQCGPAPLVKKDGTGNVVHQLVEGIVAILSKQHRCQLDLGDENADEEDIPQESSEYDWLIIETALDLMVALAAVIGPDFVELWKRLEKYVLRWASGQEGYERSATIGSIAECIAHMGEGVTPYTSSFMKILLHRVGDEDPEVKSNAVYGVGMLYEKSGDEAELLKNLGSITSKLEPLLDSEQPARIADNSAGCLSRIICRFPNRLPLKDVLPVLVDLLPLREDYEENTPVYKTIVGLYKTQNEAMLALTEQMKPALEKVLSPPEEQLNDETRGQLNELVQFLQKQ